MPENSTTLRTVKIGNENYYKITDSDTMRPFFMSIVSDSNHWMFISSNGGLTAGRKNAENALFPYYTDDKITESVEVTGSKTLFQVRNNNGNQLWEPFSERNAGKFNLSRNLYKNLYGNKVIFEEINHDLGLIYSYQWNSSNTYGFVRKSTLINTTNAPIKIKLLDGLQNILPYGVGSELQNKASNLVDAYKRSELVKSVGLGIYALSAIIVDKAEPSEALKANIVWSLGVDTPTYLLSSTQLNSFRKGLTLIGETDVKAEKGAYFIHDELTLAPNDKKDWLLVANLNQNHAAIASIANNIESNPNLEAEVNADIDLGTAHLIELSGASDGLQLTNDNLRDTRHFANTLFNIMRGGIFDDNYNIERWDFSTYLSKANTKVFQSSKNLLAQLPKVFSLSSLKEIASQSEDVNFKRLCLEYMPLKFSRRHGDPSRPWNKFSINTRSEIDGSKILDYEGNWRDIFQNWEALAHSYPEFMENMIHKFLNATTFDGYNPYRVTKDGFDWETIEPDDPWSYIGYWGDHQIIYLLKFLEFIENHKPSKLASYFDKDLFVYANVPYRIKSYSEILLNPKDTISFDVLQDDKIRQEKEMLGADGALLKDKNKLIYNVNFIEKMLATVLAKISNFIPEGGIWMNTQRPEWNDANNALVGNGVSMVTLCYLRRFLCFFQQIITDSGIESTSISDELGVFYAQISETLEAHQDLLSDTISDTNRKHILDGLGQAGSHYRATIYAKTFSGKKSALALGNLSQFITVTLRYLDHTIAANKRADNLYHAYNLMTVKGAHEISISYLDEMLEGQVAVLSAGILSSVESLTVLDALKNSALFREDQYSYILYPNKQLPKFEAKNNIPKEAVEKSTLLKKLLKDGNSAIISQDLRGGYHFNGNFNNANSLKSALSGLAEIEYKALVEQEEGLLLQIFEAVFNHKAFTGRSGTFYGYEGLGSIYWHMVSKLQLAVQECCVKAIEDGESDEVIGRLLEHYYEINEGIGVHKSPSLYGAFPTDPYSHTPAGKGAQQPGMTGQVKEDIIARFGELGVFVSEGQLQFNTRLLRRDEFLIEKKPFIYTTVSKEQKTINLEKNSLCFTYCQVPIIYKISNKNKIEVVYNDQPTQNFNSLKLDLDSSQKVFERTGEIDCIIVYINQF